jgi:hypothetical protein
MSGYKKPKTRLHKEFIYLNFDTVVNSLSAFEAGKVDEILEKVTDTREGGLGASVGYGPAKVSGAKKKTSNVEEELRRTRTTFSAFEAWSSHLEAAGAFGEFLSWNLDTRNEVEIGDTVRFRATVQLSPLQGLFLTFIDFADQAGNQDSVFKRPTSELAGLKKQARLMSSWITNRDGSKSIMVTFHPLGQKEPPVYARLDERFLVNGLEFLDGEFTVIAQVESLIGEGDSVPAMRVLRETPPTPLEITTIATALESFIEPAAALGVEIRPDDLNFKYPGLIFHPIAIFR